LQPVWFSAAIKQQNNKNLTVSGQTGKNGQLASSMKNKLKYGL